MDKIRIEKAITIVKAEMQFRWMLHKKDPIMQEKKYREMMLVRDLLEEIKAEQQTSLF